MYINRMKMEVAMNNYIIYGAKNIFTGDVYVGATTKSLDERTLDPLLDFRK